MNGVAVVPDPGDTDAFVRLPLSGQRDGKDRDHQEWQQGEQGQTDGEGRRARESSSVALIQVFSREWVMRPYATRAARASARLVRTAGTFVRPRRPVRCVARDARQQGTATSASLRNAMTSQLIAPSPEIQLLDLEKRFREVRAVDGVSLEVGAGEFFSLLGPSGCGKTTTLRMIGGFELPTSGTILLRGRDITNDPPDKRPVNMVFQNYALFPHLDVGDNIAFGLKRSGVAKPEIVRRVGEALDLVHLDGYARRKPNQLSGGQQQRVALARALVNRPNVLLLDEPLGALDLKLRKRLQIELKRIQIEVGITFVYVTHDQEEALTMSDRIAVMNRGKVEQLGTPEALYERPATRFVADFIGTTNLLRGEVVSTDADCAVVRLETGETCPVGRAGRTVGDAVDVSLRPEAISIREIDPEAGGDASDRAVRGRCRPWSSRPPTWARRSSTRSAPTGGSAMTSWPPRWAPGCRWEVPWRCPGRPTRRWSSAIDRQQWRRSHDTRTR